MYRQPPYCLFLKYQFWWFQKSFDYKEIEEKEAGEGSKAEKLTKFLLEKQEGDKERGGQKKYKLEDLIAKKKEKKLEMAKKTWYGHEWFIHRTNLFSHLNASHLDLIL